jgi:hypothetical protein
MIFNILKVLCLVSLTSLSTILHTNIFAHMSLLPSLKLTKCHTDVLTMYYMSCKSLDIYFFYCFGVSPSTTSLSFSLICKINIFVKLSLFSSFPVKSLSHSLVCFQYIPCVVKLQSQPCITVSACQSHVCYYCSVKVLHFSGQVSVLVLWLSWNYLFYYIIILFVSTLISHPLVSH